MNYQEALAYIHSVSWRGSVPGLEREIELLHKMGDPQKKLRFVHVAGTNGKGSTCSMLASVFKAAGYRTGLYTSPYINRFNERMQINGAQISDEVLAEYTERIACFADSMADKPTEFELITAIAFLWFFEQGCDIVVLEVGMGGELDATNVIEKPELCVITAMGMDHVKELGPTMKDIAHAKAGIIKENVPVVSYGGVEEADGEIARIAKLKHAPLVVVDHTLIDPGTFDLHSQFFNYGEYKDLEIPLVGKYQMNNAAVVMNAVDLLNQAGYKISEKQVRDGLRNVAWPARFELLSESPVFIVDGGHNSHGIRATAESIQRLFPGKKITFVMGMLKDKDVADCVEVIVPFSDRVYTVKPDSPRALDAEQLAAMINQAGKEAEACASIEEAVSKAISFSGSEGVVIAVGSLYMSGAVRACFYQELKPENKEILWHI